MITNKDIRVENGNLVLNGDKYPLDGQSPAAIMQIVEDNSDTTPTAESANPVTSAGIKTYVDDAVSQKLTIVETKVTTSGDSLTFDTTLQGDTMYLVAMSAATSAATRRMRLSIIKPVNITTNEIYVGSSDFTVSVSALKLSITSSGVAYGIKASLIKLE